jgi:hypothetical protein
MAQNSTQWKLSHLTPFSKGGNRLCFVHPKASDRCLKVLTNESKPEVKRRKKKFPANLRPLSYFDENEQEYHSLKHLFLNYPERITRHLPRSYGITHTDLGKAHEATLIRDENGLISQTLEQYLWNHGRDQIANDAIQLFFKDWLAGAPTTRDLLPHNLVIQIQQHTANLVLIDGYGRKARIPIPASLVKRKNREQIERLKIRIQTIFDRKSAGDMPKPRILQLNRAL